MDGLALLFTLLTAVFILAVLAMNFANSAAAPLPLEGFVAAKEDDKESSIPLQIKTILEPMSDPDLCPIFTTVRETISKNEQAGQSLSPEELQKRVESILTLGIPGGPLPCPLLQYPKDSATDLEWLDFLQKIPPDFGARVVFMALYARKVLVRTELELKGSLSDEKKVVTDIKVNAATTDEPPKVTRAKLAAIRESFQPLCPPDVAQSRRAERAAAGRVQAACSLPEDMSPEEIQSSVTQLLKTLVSQKTAVLKSKNVDPNLDIKPILEQTKSAISYLNMKKQEIESGTLRMDRPLN